ncbi:MAG: CoxG family protein [Halanaeroarchaeum sp.]
MSDVEPTTSDDGSDDFDGKRLEFADTVAIDTTKDALWATISDPEVLTVAVPGAESIERVSKTKYTVDIRIGVSHLNVALDGDVEFVEMNEPDWIVASGSAFDSTTGSDFDILAAMEMEENGSGTDLSYTAEVTYTGGVASLSQRLLRPIVEKNVNAYFDNIRDEVESREAE